MAFVCAPRKSLTFLTCLLVCGWIWTSIVKQAIHKDSRGTSGAMVKEEDDSWCPMAYTAPTQFGLKGQRGLEIHVDPDLMRRLGIPLTDFVQMNEDTFDQFVFVTAASQNHAKEIADGIASIQVHFPNKKIIFYDLGLTPESRQQIGSFCGVTIRNFNFSAYPDHVKNLHVYSWKIMIILGLLREFPGVLWMDASIRLKSGDFTSVFEKLKHTGGATQFKDTNYSNYALTHPRTYDYFPTLVEKQKEVRQSIGGILLLFRTELSYKKILHWWFICALDPACISPTTNKIRNFTDTGGDTFRSYLQAHRFDQAVMSLLNSNQFGFNSSRYTLAIEDRRRTMVVLREITTLYDVKTCAR